MILVVDASVAAKWFADEQLAGEALSILAPFNQLHAPDFLFLEIDSIISKWIRRGIITEAEGNDTRAAIRQVPIITYHFESYQDSAYYIAVKTHRSVYDCLYIALAAFLGGQMVTADRRLYNGLSGGPFGRNIVWLEDVGNV